MTSMSMCWVSTILHGFPSASYKGIDLFPVYRDYISAHFEEGYQVEGENWMNSSFKCANRVKMDLFNRYGLIAAAGDRHLAEFMPGDEYLKDPEDRGLMEIRPYHRGVEKEGPSGTAG